MNRLGPGDMPRMSGVQVVEDEPVEEPLTDDQVDHIVGQLNLLREQFPPDQIEKLPKAKWRGAWDGKRASSCEVCHGYHVLDDCIHLDYVGHANVTNRLLQVDPFWNWQPMSWTEQNTPRFTDSGLWIYLTVCGVTRIGYGDGKSIKEIIGDAIRNAAMRFGVGLDLWAKVDLHAEQNPGDGATPRERHERAAQRERGGDQVQQQRRDSPPAQRPARDVQGGATRPDPPRAANQDALDALGEICDDNGVDRRWAAERFESDYDLKINFAAAELIYEFGSVLLAEFDAPDSEGDTVPPEGEAGPEVRDQGGEAGGDDGAGDGVGEGDVRIPPSGDPTDTSDVEQKPDDLF